MKRYTEKELKREKGIHYKFIKKTNQVWNKCNCSSPSIIGGLLEILENSNCVDFEEWQEEFYSNVSSEQLNKCYSIFVKSLKENNIEYTQEEVVITILVRCILETWDGYMGERAAFVWLCKHNEIKKIEKTDKYTDYEMGIDLIITLSNKKRIGIQIKPISFLVSCTLSNKNILEPQKQKMRKWLSLDKNNLDTFILIYDENKIITPSELKFHSCLEYWKTGRVSDV